MKRLVVGHKRDGRSWYDKEAKRELIEAAMRPGVSVAGIAFQHGINANLVRTWITHYRRHREAVVGRPASAMEVASVGSAFVPVVATGAPARSRPVRFGVQLPNGIKLELSEVGPDELTALLRLLCELPGGAIGSSYCCGTEPASGC